MKKIRIAIVLLAGVLISDGFADDLSRQINIFKAQKQNVIKEMNIISNNKNCTGAQNPAADIIRLLNENENILNKLQNNKIQIDSAGRNKLIENNKAIRIDINKLNRIPCSQSAVPNLEKCYDVLSAISTEQHDEANKTIDNLK